MLNSSMESVGQAIGFCGLPLSRALLVADSTNRSSASLLVFGCLIFLCLLTTACFTTQAKPVPRTFVPPPVQPPPTLPAGPPVLEAGLDLEIAPVTHLAEIVEIPTPDYPAWAPSKAITPPKRTNPPPKTIAPEPEAPAPAPPKITQYFSDDDRRRYEQEYLSSQDHVKKNLAALENRTLNASQKQTLERIQIFQSQAEKEYERDLVTAVNLARRADALSSDLLNRLR
jgi:hypothetical protein